MAFTASRMEARTCSRWQFPIVGGVRCAVGGPHEAECAAEREVDGGGEQVCDVAAAERRAGNRVGCLSVAARDKGETSGPEPVSMVRRLIGLGSSCSMTTLSPESKRIDPMRRLG